MITLEYIRDDGVDLRVRSLGTFSHIETVKQRIDSHAQAIGVEIFPIDWEANIDLNLLPEFIHGYITQDRKHIWSYEPPHENDID